MFKNYLGWLYLLLCSTTFLSCSQDGAYVALPENNPVQISPVNFDIEAMPYPSLSDYNFFEGDMKDLNPVYGVLPYDLISPLFSDYAKKKRFVWMPEGSKANYVNDYSILDFPVGTILVKNFYYENTLPNHDTRILETRLQIKKSTGWVFANYKWNDEQTEATFDLNGSFVAVDFMEKGTQKSVNYVIPSAAQCLTCHKSDDDVPLPIGPKPQNLNLKIDYTSGQMNQLEKWVEMGYLNNDFPSNINSMVNFNDDTQPLELRVRSYLDVNCAHCHSDNRHCDYRPVRFAFHESLDLTNLGVCVEGNEIFDQAITKIVSPGNSERSILSVRMNSVAPDLRMPLLGRTIRHEEGIDLIEQWIASLSNVCN